MEPIQTIFEHGLHGEIFYDECADPAEFAGFREFKLALFHKRYSFPNDESLSLEEAMHLEMEDDTMHVCTVYLYDHSGLAFSTSKLSCPWDSGKLGIAYAPKEGGAFRSEEEFIAVVTRWCEMYTSACAGEFYGYTVTECLGEEIDSCWGFLGLDSAVDSCREAMLSLAKEHGAMKGGV